MYVVRETHERVERTPEGRLVAAVDGELLEYQPYEVIEVCDVCEEYPTGDDPLGHFKGEVIGSYVLAHGQCGADEGLELA